MTVFCFLFIIAHIQPCHFYSVLFGGTPGHKVSTFFFSYLFHFPFGLHGCHSFDLHWPFICLKSARHFFLFSFIMSFNLWSCLPIESPLSLHPSLSVISNTWDLLYTPLTVELAHWDHVRRVAWNTLDLIIIIIRKAKMDRREMMICRSSGAIEKNCSLAPFVISVLILALQLGIARAYIDQIIIIQLSIICSTSYEPQTIATCSKEGTSLCRNSLCIRWTAQIVSEYPNR